MYLQRPLPIFIRIASASALAREVTLNVTDLDLPATNFDFAKPDFNPAKLDEQSIVLFSIHD